MEIKKASIGAVGEGPKETRKNDLRAGTALL